MGVGDLLFGAVCGMGFRPHLWLRSGHLTAGPCLAGTTAAAAPTQAQPCTQVKGSGTGPACRKAPQAAHPGEVGLACNCPMHGTCANRGWVWLGRVGPALGAVEGKPLPAPGSRCCLAAQGYVGQWREVEMYGAACCWSTAALAGQRAPSQHTKDGQASQCQEARWCYDVGSSQARSLRITCFGCAWLWLLLLVTETAGQPLLGFLVVRFAR